MKNREDNDAAIIERLLQDEQSDWHDQLNDLEWRYRAYYNRFVCLYDMYADDDLESVVTRVERYMGVYV